MGPKNKFHEKADKDLSEEVWGTWNSTIGVIQTKDIAGHGRGAPASQKINVLGVNQAYDFRQNV